MSGLAAIPLGINLSFAVKRWVTPELWSQVVRDTLGLDHVQFSFDLVDPLWPAAILDRHAQAIRRAAAEWDLTVHSAFIGLAHYTFNQLLHPDPAVRDFAEAWLGRAYSFAAQAGIMRVGGPLGAIASRVDGEEADAIPAADYDDLVARLLRLGQRARSEGLRELYIEPTPMRREWPWTVGQAQQLLVDVAGSPVPWHYCLDWGHGTVEPLYGAGAGMRPWFVGLGDAVTAVHIQQTDFQSDRHWDFSVPGAVVPAEAAALLRESGLAEVPVFLEVFYPFERDDASILAALRLSVAALRGAFG